MIELSAAVERVLANARETAAMGGALASSTPHVMHALFHDESRAYAILSAAGYTLNDLSSDFQLAPEGGADAEPVIVDDRTVAAAVQQSRRWIRDTPGESEVQTEHLLAALAAVDDDVAGLFRRLGLTPDGVRGVTSAESHEPVDIDEPPPRPLDPPASTGDPPATASHSQSADHSVFRILDAAANRAREGLRVVEDAARFILDDPHLCRLLKSLRHELAAALVQLGGDRFHVQRDTTGDVGATLSTAAEARRQSVGHVLRANCKRVEESLRTLEEYGKLIDPNAAATIEHLRYRFYTIEKALLTTDASRQRLANCRLYLLVTEIACRTGIERVIKAALQAGAGAIQLREKDGDDRRLLQLAGQVREWTTAADSLFILNDRPDIAVLSGADGVHVGQDDLSVQHVRRIVGADPLVGVSTHSIQQARQAVLDGADYLGVGPTFASQTKQFESFAGLEFIRAVAAEIALPWFAIGGITAENISGVTEAGATRVAVSSVVCTAEDSAAATRELTGKLPIAN